MGGENTTRDSRDYRVVRLGLSFLIRGPPRWLQLCGELSFAQDQLRRGRQVLLYTILATWHEEIDILNLVGASGIKRIIHDFSYIILMRDE